MTWQTVKKNGVKRRRIVITPRHVHSRVALHSLATATSAVIALRMGSGNPWSGLAWYCGSFVGFHAVMVPFMATWYMLTDRVERWIRGIIEEELVRFDLKTYDRQLRRVFPVVPKPPGGEDPRE